MNDVLPEESGQWQWLESIARRVFAAYGYREIRFPLVERTELFQRAIGDVTDIVEKEMYSFESRGGDSLSLRPEGTAGCVRACVQHGLLHNQQQRLWYAGPMFRYERPQAGRYRQFHQFGVEAYGIDGHAIDAEVIALSARLWRELGLDGLTLEINSLGSSEARAAYREALVDYLREHAEALDEDSRKRLERNPLRVLDAKDAGTRAVLEGAPSILDHLDDESAEQFDALRERLDALGIEYTVNPRLVRGLDYYSRVVFEWTTDRLGAQSAICAGGRYDGLVEQLGGGLVPAIGFAIGIERLLLLLRETERVQSDDAPHAYLCWQGEAAREQALMLGEALRDALPGLRLLSHADEASLKSQIRKADRSGARLALIIGEQESAADTVQVKSLREIAPQRELPRRELADTLAVELSLASTSAR